MATGRTRWHPLPGLVILSLLLIACGRVAPNAAQPGPSPTPQPTFTTFGPVTPTATPGVPPSPPSALALGDNCTQTTGALTGGFQVLKRVTAVAEGSFDRVTFEFTTLAAPVAVTPVTMTAATTPGVQDGSGLPIRMAGRAFIRIVFLDASTHDTLNTPPKAGYSGPLDLRPALRQVVEVKLAGDFEGYLTWVIGLSGRACWNAQVLSSPARLVVDIPNTLSVTG